MPAAAPVPCVATRFLGDAGRPCCTATCAVGGVQSLPSSTFQMQAQSPAAQIVSEPTNTQFRRHGAGARRPSSRFSPIDSSRCVLLRADRADDGLGDLKQRAVGEASRHPLADLRRPGRSRRTSTPRFRSQGHVSVAAPSAGMHLGEQPVGALQQRHACRCARVHAGDSSAPCSSRQSARAPGDLDTRKSRRPMMTKWPRLAQRAMIVFAAPSARGGATRCCGCAWHRRRSSTASACSAMPGIRSSRARTPSVSTR